MRRRSSSRSAACSGAAARSTAPSPSIPGCASTAASALRDKAAFALALDYLSAGLMDRAERLLEELAASREYRKAALDHLVRHLRGAGRLGQRAEGLPRAAASGAGASGAASRRTTCASWPSRRWCRGMPSARGTLLRQARTHQADLPRADILTARITELAGRSGRGAVAVPARRWRPPRGWRSRSSRGC